MESITVSRKALSGYVQLVSAIHSWMSKIAIQFFVASLLSFWLIVFLFSFGLNAVELHKSVLLQDVRHIQSTHYILFPKFLNNKVFFISVSYEKSNCLLEMVWWVMYLRCSGTIGTSQRLFSKDFLYYRGILMGGMSIYEYKLTIKDDFSRSDGSRSWEIGTIYKDMDFRMFVVAGSGYLQRKNLDLVTIFWLSRHLYNCMAGFHGCTFIWSLNCGAWVRWSCHEELRLKNAIGVGSVLWRSILRSLEDKHGWLLRHILDNVIEQCGISSCQRWYPFSCLVMHSGGKHIVCIPVLSYGFITLIILEIWNTRNLKSYFLWFSGLYICGLCHFRCLLANLQKLKLWFFRTLIVVLDWHLFCRYPGYGHTFWVEEFWATGLWGWKIEQAAHIVTAALSKHKEQTSIWNCGCQDFWSVTIWLERSNQRKDLMWNALQFGSDIFLLDNNGFQQGFMDQGLKEKRVYTKSFIP